MSHMERLLAGIDAWNRWRTEHPDVDPDLRGVSLRGLVLVGANLVRADLTDADLSGARLQGANLAYAVLHHANLVGANMTAATIRSTDLRDVHFDESTVWPQGVNPPRRLDRPDERSDGVFKRFSVRKERLDALEAAMTARDLEALLREAMRAVDDESADLNADQENLIRANVSTINDQLRGPDPDVVIIERAVARVISLLAPDPPEFESLQTMIEQVTDHVGSAAQTVEALQSLVTAAASLGQPSAAEDVAQANTVANMLEQLEASGQRDFDGPHPSRANEIKQSQDRQSRIAEARLRGIERFYSEVMPANVGKLTVAMTAGIGAGIVAVAGRTGAIVQAIKAVLRFFG